MHIYGWFTDRPETPAGQYGTPGRQDIQNPAAQSQDTEARQSDTQGSGPQQTRNQQSPQMVGWFIDRPRQALSPDSISPWIQYRSLDEDLVGVEEDVEYPEDATNDYNDDNEAMRHALYTVLGPEFRTHIPALLDYGFTFDERIVNYVDRGTVLLSRFTHTGTLWIRDSSALEELLDDLGFTDEFYERVNSIFTGVSVRGEEYYLPKPYSTERVLLQRLGLVRGYVTHIDNRKSPQNFAQQLLEKGGDHGSV